MTNTDTNTDPETETDTDTETDSDTNTDIDTSPDPATAPTTGNAETDQAAEQESAADEGPAPSVDPPGPESPEAPSDEGPDPSRNAASDAPTGGDNPDDDEDRTSSVRTYVYWVVLAGLVFFGGLMVLLVYSDVRSLIGIFIAPEYQLVIQTAFHVVVLLSAAIGVSLVVRRLERLPG